MTAFRSTKHLAPRLLPRFRPSSSLNPHFTPTIATFSASFSRLDVKRHQSTFQPTLSSPTPPPPKNETSSSSSPSSSCLDYSTPLANLPTKDLLRGLILHSVSANKFLLENGTKFLLNQAHSIEENWPLKWAIMQTFYVSSPYSSFANED